MLESGVAAGIASGLDAILLHTHGGIVAERRTAAAIGVVALRAFIVTGMAATAGPIAVEICGADLLFPIYHGRLELLSVPIGCASNPGVLFCHDPSGAFEMRHGVIKHFLISKQSA